jgi:hypothetical protein
VFDIIPDVCARNNIDDQQSLVGKVTADSAGHGLGSLKTADSFSIHKWPLPVFFSFGCTTAIETKNQGTCCTKYQKLVSQSVP